MRHSWSFLVSSLVAVLLILGVMASCSAAGASSNNLGSTVSLHVISCPTTYASSESKGSIPATASITVTRALAHDFGLYTDLQRTMAPLLAPRGWHCSALVGEDGSATFKLYPSKTSPAQSEYANAEEVVASTDGACQGCIAGTVCPYFENAQAQIGYTGTSCTTTKPNNEQDDYVSGSNTSTHGLVDTFDPSSKKSKYTVIGVLRYDDVPGAEAEDAKETCVLPKSKAILCHAITNEFIAKSWEFGTLNPPPATTTTTTLASPSAQWFNICSSQAFTNNGWVSTDGLGNKSEVGVCGYSVTGEDAAGDSAPAGFFFVNIVFVAGDLQTDRGAGVSDAGIYITRSGDSCSANGDYYWSPNLDTPPPACLDLSDSFYDLSETGASAPDSSPEVQPGPGSMYFVSTLVPADWVQNGIELEGNGFVASATLGAGKETADPFYVP